MDPLEYFEREAARTFAALVSDFTSFHERTYKLLSLLVGGGGAAGVYVLAELAKGSTALEWWPIAALSIWWFGIAVLLLMSSLRSFELSNGPTPGTLGNFYRKHQGDESGEESECNASALRATRWAELRTMNDRMGKYRTANNWRAAWLDFAYLLSAASPGPALVALICAWRSVG